MVSKRGLHGARVPSERKKKKKEKEIRRRDVTTTSASLSPVPTPSAHNFLDLIITNLLASIVGTMGIWLDAPFSFAQVGRG